MNDAIPAQNRTLAASEAESGLPTDQGAREALVEQLAEAILLADDDWERDPVHATGTWDAYLARAVLPLVAAQVEAAVSVVRAEGDQPGWEGVSRGEAIRQANEFHAGQLRWIDEHDKRRAERDEARADLRALREGLEAIVNDPKVYAGSIRDRIRALLASSPAEGTGEGRLNCPVCGSGEEGDCACGPRDRCICNDPPVAREVVCRPHPNAHLSAPSPAEGTGEAVCCGDHDEDGGRPCNGCPERAPEPAPEGGALIDGHYPRCNSRCIGDVHWLHPAPVSSGEAGRTLGCMWCDEDSCNHGAMRAERESDETGQVATRWVDSQGDVWTFDADGIGTSRECANFSRKYVEKKWGPLRPAPVVTPSASGDES